MVQLERELEGMRTSGVDLRAKQAEVDAAKRNVEETHDALIAAQKCVQPSVQCPESMRAPHTGQCWASLGVGSLSKPASR